MPKTRQIIDKIGPLHLITKHQCHIMVCCVHDGSRIAMVGLSMGSDQTKVSNYTLYIMYKRPYVVVIGPLLGNTQAHLVTLVQGYWIILIHRHGGQHKMHLLVTFQSMIFQLSIYVQMSSIVHK